MNNQTAVKEENFVAGLVGAFLFSLVGGIIWYLLYQIGFISAISGVVGVVCAIKGYALFGKKESIKGVVASLIITLVVMVGAWYFCLSTDVYNFYKEAYAMGEIEFPVSFGESVSVAYHFLSEPEIAAGYFKDLAMGLVFCIIGAIGSVKIALSRVKSGNSASNAASEN
jgi:hypothetical protein